MRIANPIYDVVIKYLLEDDVIAKDFLSALLGRKIVALEFKPIEKPLKTEKGLTVRRFDFKALVKYKTKKLEKVLIEIQKSQSGFKLRRFREYLGINYSEPDEVQVSDIGHAKIDSIPIMTIYILGFEIASVDTPLLQINRVYKDLVSGKIIKPHKYIENLTHDSLIIQIPRLRMEAQTTMEQVLDVFNEEKYKTDNPQILDYTGDTTNPVVNRMVKRLSMALADPSILHQLYHEKLLADEEVERKAEKEKQDKKLAKQEKKLVEKDEVIAEKDEVIAEIKGELVEKDEVIAEIKGELAEIKGELVEKDEVIAEKDKMIAELLEKMKKLNGNI